MAVESKKHSRTRWEYNVKLEGSRSTSVQINTTTDASKVTIVASPFVVGVRRELSFEKKALPEVIEALQSLKDDLAAHDRPGGFGGGDR